MLKLIINGVHIKHSLCRRSLLSYSTATKVSKHPTTSMVDYLVDTLGFSREEAVSASKNVSRQKKSPEKLNSVLDFFKQIGLSQSQIKIMVSHDARLLSFRDINKTLIPKIRVFQELGLSDSELGHVLSSAPWIFLKSLETHIKPLIECLRSILGSQENVVKAIKRHPTIANYNPKRLVLNATLLKSYGLSEERLRKLVLYNPWHLTCEIGILEKRLKDVEATMGIPSESHMFLYGMYAFSSLSKDTIESKFKVFRSYGWTENDIQTIVRNLPICLKLSEAKMIKGLDFFMKEMSFESDYIARFPSLLNFSLENRVLPRRAIWKALIEKDLITRKVGFCHFVYLPEHRFLKEYVLPFKDQLPELIEGYINKRVSSSVTVA